MAKDTTKQELVKHWILVNRKKASIYNKPYLSLGEAQRDLVSLSAKNPEHGYVLEKRETWMDSEYKEDLDF